jgi:hypothetical protein
MFFARETIYRFHNTYFPTAQIYNSKDLLMTLFLLLLNFELTYYTISDSVYANLEVSECSRACRCCLENKVLHVMCRYSHHNVKLKPNFAYLAKVVPISVTARSKP